MKRIVFLVLLMGSAVTAQAQDRQEGAKWATNVCGECHAVRPGQPRSRNRRAPVELANIPEMTTAASDRRACLARGTILPDDHDVVEK